MAVTLRDGGGNELARETVLGWAPRGWRPSVALLIDDLEKLRWDGEVFLVKEKFGGLRFYVGAASEAVHRRIAETESESERLCEVCGRPGGRIEVRYWVNTLCGGEHADAVRAGKAARQVAQELDR